MRSLPFVHIRLSKQARKLLPSTVPSRFRLATAGGAREDLEAAVAHRITHGTDLTWKDLAMYCTPDDDRSEDLVVPLTSSLEAGTALRLFVDTTHAVSTTAETESQPQTAEESAEATHEGVPASGGTKKRKRPKTGDEEDPAAGDQSGEGSPSTNTSECQPAKKRKKKMGGSVLDSWQDGAQTLEAVAESDAAATESEKKKKGKKKKKRQSDAAPGKECGAQDSEGKDSETRGVTATPEVKRKKKKNKSAKDSNPPNPSSVTDQQDQEPPPPPSQQQEQTQREPETGGQEMGTGKTQRKPGMGEATANQELESEDAPSETKRKRAGKKRRRRRSRSGANEAAEQSEAPKPKEAQQVDHGREPENRTHTSDLELVSKFAVGAPALSPQRGASSSSSSSGGRHIRFNDDNDDEDGEDRGVMGGAVAATATATGTATAGTFDSIQGSTQEQTYTNGFEEEEKEEEEEEEEEEEPALAQWEVGGQSWLPQESSTTEEDTQEETIPKSLLAFPEMPLDSVIKVQKDDMIAYQELSFDEESWSGTGLGRPTLTPFRWAKVLGQSARDTLTVRHLKEAEALSTDPATHLVRRDLYPPPRHPLTCLIRLHVGIKWQAFGGPPVHITRQDMANVRVIRGPSFDSLNQTGKHASPKPVASATDGEGEGAGEPQPAGLLAEFMNEIRERKEAVGAASGS